MPTCLKSTCRLPIWILLTVGCGVSAVSQAAPRAPAEEDLPLKQRVLPILQKHCVKCHGPDKESSGLRVDTREALLRGGDRGPAIIPGDAENSLLFAAIRYQQEDLQMPPAGKLKADEIQAMRDWIESGASW